MAVFEYHNGSDGPQTVTLIPPDRAPSVTVLPPQASLKTTHEKAPPGTHITVEGDDLDAAGVIFERVEAVQLSVRWDPAPRRPEALEGQRPVGSPPQEHSTTRRQRSDNQIDRPA